MSTQAASDCEALCERWQRSFGAHPAWKRIEQSYGEPHRHYHTYAHLQTMFGAYDEVRVQLHFPEAVELAIWFHDLVYQINPALYAQNETDSARTMREVLGLAPLSSPYVEALPMAEALILATRNHCPSEALLETAERAADARLFLDLDMLGMAVMTPHDYEQAIRAEFAPVVGGWVYRIKRAEVLEHFQKQEQIFQSSWGQSYERAARNNIAAMRAMLPPPWLCRPLVRLIDQLRKYQ